MSKAGRKQTVCIISSAGGHLTEALIATRDLKVPMYFVTFDQPHVHSLLKGEEVYFIQDPHQKLHLHLKNMFQSLILFLRKRPKIVITTGAGIAVTLCLLVKLTGGKLIFIETGARVTSPSLTGRILYRFSDLFIIQWVPLKKYYPRAVYGGVML